MGEDDVIQIFCFIYLFIYYFFFFGTIIQIYLTIISNYFLIIYEENE